jgi:hypothetical protein
MTFATVLGLGLSILAVLLTLSWVSRPAGIRSLAVLPVDNFPAILRRTFCRRQDRRVDHESGTDQGPARGPRTSVIKYKGTRKPLREIARELKADAVVEGSVLRSGTSTLQQQTSKRKAKMALAHIW